MKPNTSGFKTTVQKRHRNNYITIHFITLFMHGYLVSVGGRSINRWGSD